MSVLRWIVLALAAGLVVIAGVYLWQMGRAYDRIAGQSKVFDMQAASASNTWRAARVHPCLWCMEVAAASIRGR
jgi:hypothetical protein